MQPDVAWFYFAKFVLSEHNFKKQKKHDFDFGPFCHSRTEAQIRTCAAHSATN